MSEPNIVLEQISPNGNVQVVVEQDDDVAYIYLFAAPELEIPMRACWLRNLKLAPTDLTVKQMRAQGKPPMLPNGFCAHPGGAPPLNADALRVLWTPDGDEVILFESDEPLAWIPAWGGTKGFDGYARDCIGQSPVCWSLSEAEERLQSRIEESNRFWESWDVSDPWTPVQDALLEAIESNIGQHTRYFAIDGGEWPPRAIAYIPVQGGAAFVTVGMSVRPQPKVEMYESTNYRRVEIGIALRDPVTDEDVQRLGGYISAQCSYPWSQYSFFAANHTLACDSVPGMEAILFRDALPDAPKVALPRYQGDQPKLLWMTPITSAEWKLAQEAGSDALVQKLDQAVHGWLHRDRASVI